jgi:hypothetical protein
VADIAIPVLMTSRISPSQRNVSSVSKWKKLSLDRRGTEVALWMIE